MNSDGLMEAVLVAALPMSVAATIQRQKLISYQKLHFLVSSSVMSFLLLCFCLLCVQNTHLSLTRLEIGILNV